MWIIILSIAVILAAFAYIEFGNPLPASTKYIAPGLSFGSSDRAGVALADNDWQKVLTGTDPAAMQGKSLGTGTKPAKAAPLTQTEKLGQYLVSGYLQLQQSGEDIGTDTVDALVSNALNNPDIVETAKTYAFSDLKTSKDTSIVAVVSYGQSVVALFKNNDALGNEAAYARDAEEQNDPTVAAKIDPIIATYQSILNSLLATPTPPTLLKIHLDLVNAMSERLMVAKLLRSVNTDPAAGLEGAGQYLNALQDFNNAFGALKQYFGTVKANVAAVEASSTSEEQAYNKIISNENIF